MKRVLCCAVFVAFVVVRVSGQEEDAPPDTKPEASAGSSLPSLPPIDVIKAHPDRIKGERLFVELMGRPARTKVKALREDTIIVTVMGGEMPVPFSQIPARRLLSLARKVAETDELLGLAVFCHNEGMTE